MSTYFTTFLEKSLKDLKQPLYSDKLIIQYKSNFKINDDNLIDCMEDTIKDKGMSYISYILDNKKYLIVLPVMCFDIKLNIS